MAACAERAACSLLTSAPSAASGVVVNSAVGCAAGDFIACALRVGTSVLVGGTDQRVCTGIAHADAAKKTINAKIRIGFFIGLVWFGKGIVLLL